VALNLVGAERLKITTGIADIMLRQFIARSEFLAPLGSIAETCWLIMLRLFATASNETASADELGIVINMPSERITRYLEVLEYSSFIETVAENGGYRLVEATHMEIDAILRLAAQDILSSFGR
jgi:hypothetical protein